MVLEYAIMCQQHREALIVSRFGGETYAASSRASPGTTGFEVLPFTPEFVPETIQDAEQPLYERVKELLTLFVERHPACALTIGHDREEERWPWGHGDRIHPQVEGGHRHPSGWTLFDVLTDVEWIRLFFGLPEFDPEELPEELPGGMVRLARVLRSRPSWDRSADPG